MLMPMGFLASVSSYPVTHSRIIPPTPNTRNSNWLGFALPKMDLIQELVLFIMVLINKQCNEKKLLNILSSDIKKQISKTNFQI